MATWEDVRRVALALPEAEERTSRAGLLSWQVRGRVFAWERPLRRSDLDALGDAAPGGPILGVRAPDLGAKEALVAGEPACFTTPHFDGYPAVLVRLADAPPDVLVELITEAWLDRAPVRLARAFLDGRG